MKLGQNKELLTEDVQRWKNLCYAMMHGLIMSQLLSMFIFKSTVEKWGGLHIHEFLAVSFTTYSFPSPNDLLYFEALTSVT